MSPCGKESFALINLFLQGMVGVLRGGSLSDVTSDYSGLLTSKPVHCQPTCTETINNLEDVHAGGVEGSDLDFIKILDVCGTVSKESKKVVN